jgi:hypothetical protein
VDLRACRNSGGRSFGAFFGVCDAVSCILSSTGSLPFSFLRMSSSSSSSYFLLQNQLDLSHRLMIGVFFFPDFFRVCLFFLVKMPVLWFEMHLGLVRRLFSAGCRKI